MSELFKLVSEKFSKKDNEWQWTYYWLARFTFNDWTINEITITDHYQIEHKLAITNNLILKLLSKRLNGKRGVKPLPESYLWKKDIFRFDTSYHGKDYRLVFWFKNNTTNHLWIRNCYPID